MEPKKKTSKHEYTPAPRKNSDGKYSKKTESEKLKQDQETSWNTPRKKYPDYNKPSGGNYSKETESKRMKKDQETSWNTPRKKYPDYNKPAIGSPIDEHKKTSPKKVIAKPVDSKKINDKKTGSSGKKNPHTPSSKERIY